MDGFENSPFVNRVVAVATLLFLAFLIWASDYAQWAVRITMCTLFCSIIYLRERSPTGRWIAIGIIAIGTLVSLIWPI